MKEKINEIIDKVKNDKDFMEKFKKDPIAAVEEVVGVNLPEEKINNIIETVKAKIKIDDSNILGKVKGLFDKK